MIDPANALFQWQLFSVVGCSLGILLTILKIWDVLRPKPPMHEQISAAIERMITDYATKVELREVRTEAFEEMDRVEERCSNREEIRELKESIAHMQASISLQFNSLERAIGRLEGVKS